MWKGNNPRCRAGGREEWRMKRNEAGISPFSPILPFCRGDHVKSWGQEVQPADPIPPPRWTSHSEFNTLPGEDKQTHPAPLRISSQTGRKRHHSSCCIKGEEECVAANRCGRVTTSVCSWRRSISAQTGSNPWVASALGCLRVTFL